VNRRWLLVGGLGCGFLLVVTTGFVLLFALLLLPIRRVTTVSEAPAGPAAVPVVVATLPAAAPSGGASTAALLQALPEGFQEADALVDLYNQTNPGVVNIRVTVQSFGGQGQGTGSGFILDEAGHIVTNNHVVSGATTVTVVFFDGFEARAEVVGTDPDSDLAVIRVDDLPDNVHPLPLADSDQVRVGEWVVAIGSPFGLGSTLTVGVVSALERSIPSGATPFDIPQAIQTDAALNPGNSGGPLLNLDGQVVGVNAQIAASGTGGNLGVGFAIPSNVVRRVAPSLIEVGGYQWPWLGVEIADVGLLIAEANNLPSQDGAMIATVVSGGPAEAAGLRGATGTRNVGGQPVPIGGDVVVAFNGEPVVDSSHLLVLIANSDPRDQVTLTILRNGQEQDVTVNLRPRPSDFRQ
jgi:2-alkenal reductase